MLVVPWCEEEQLCISPCSDDMRNLLPQFWETIALADTTINNEIEGVLETIEH
jgi:hypothetical protein